MAKKRVDFSSLDDEALTLGDLLGAQLGDKIPPAAKTAEATVPKAEPRAIDLRGALRVSIEKKGRGGKTVTKLTGLGGAAAVKTAFLKELKRSLGCGASEEEGAFFFQGDQRQRLIDLLKSKGASNVK